MPLLVQLPVGPQPGWELEDDSINPDGGDFRSIPDSLVILQTLKQSRDTWITRTFPQFSGRNRGKSGKSTSVAPPRHTLKGHGRFDLTIGPHIFPKTSVYEIHYIPDTPAPISEQPSFSAKAPRAPESASQSQLSGLPIFDGVVTPELVSQVNSEALQNRELGTLLTLVVNHRATAEQVQALALLIRNLPKTNSGQASSAPSSSSPVPSRDFDIVIEFQERPSDRWVLPRGTVLVEKRPPKSHMNAFNFWDLVLIASLPFEGMSLPPAAEEEASMGNAKLGSDITPQLVKFRWSNLPGSLCDMFVAWAGGEHRMAENKAKLKALKQTPRTYLPHQLPEGELLTKVEEATAPIYSLKPLKQTSDKPRTRNTQRKQSTARKENSTRLANATLQSKQPPQLQPQATPTPGHEPSGSTSSSSQAAHYQGMFPIALLPNTQYMHNPASSSSSYTSAPSQQPNTQSPTQHAPTIPAKRRRSSQAQINTRPTFKFTAPGPSSAGGGRVAYQIACSACGMTDVPLLMGGRFCRKCLDTGRAMSEVLGPKDSEGESSDSPSRLTYYRESAPRAIEYIPVPPTSSASRRTPSSSTPTTTGTPYTYNPYTPPPTQPQSSSQTQGR